MPTPMMLYGVVSLFLEGNFLDYNVLQNNPVQGQHLGILLVELGVGITVAAVTNSMYARSVNNGRIMAPDLPVGPEASVCCSSKMTEPAPVDAKWKARLAPCTPPPTITKSAVAFTKPTRGTRSF